MRQVCPSALLVSVIIKIILSGTIRGKNDEVVKCSMGERSIRFNVNKFSGCILETVSRQSTKDIHGWVSDERTVYPSRGYQPRD